jgi:hypothetical protein
MRDLRWLSFALPSHPQDSESEVCPTCSFNRIATYIERLEANASLATEECIKERITLATEHLIAERDALLAEHEAVGVLMNDAECITCPHRPALPITQAVGTAHDHAEEVLTS